MLFEDTRAEDLIKKYGPDYLKRIERFIIKNRLGAGSIVRLKNDPKTYVIKNLHNDGVTMFVAGMNGLGVWNKRIDQIIRGNNKDILFEDLRNGHNELIIDWSALKDHDLQWLSEDLAATFSAHSIDRAEERSEDKLDIAKKEISDLIYKAKDQLESFAGKFRTFILKGKNDLNVVGALIRQGANYIFKIITVMWKKNFYPKPNDKVIDLKEAKEICVEDKLHDKNSIESKLKKILKSDPSEEIIRKFAKDNDISVQDTQEMIWKLTSKLLNNKSLFESEMTISSEEGLAAGLTVESIAAKHNVSVDIIKRQLAIGIAVEAKEHTYDLKAARKIALDHLVENPYYYDPYLKQMEAKAEKELKEGKLLKEAEPVNTDEVIAGEPQPIVSEETQSKVEVKREIQNIANQVEDVIINAEDWHTMVPVEINALERLGNILKALTSLQLEIDASTTLIKESVKRGSVIHLDKPLRAFDGMLDIGQWIVTEDPSNGEIRVQNPRWAGYPKRTTGLPVKLIDLEKAVSRGEATIKEGVEPKEIKVAEPAGEKDKRELLLDKSKNPISDELENFNYDIEDVEDIIRSHYTITEEKPGEITISVRNPKYNPQSTLDVMNYMIKIYYDKNYVGVYAEGGSENGEKIAHRVEKEIIQDLAHMSGYILPDDFVSKHAEPLEEGIEHNLDPQLNQKGNELLQKTLLSLYGNKQFEGFEVIGNSNDEEENDIRASNEADINDEAYKFEYELNYKVKENMNEEEFLLAAEKTKTVSKLDRPETNMQPEEYTDSELVDAELKEVYFSGDRLILNDDTKAIIRQTLKLKVY